MRCSVGIGVTLRIFVINISSSSPAITTVPYYQRCVITCETVRRWPWSTGDPVDNTWPVAALTAGTKARYRLRIAISAYPTAFDAPVRGSSSEYCCAVWLGNTRMMGLPEGEKILMICLLVLTKFTNVTETQTHRHRVMA